MYFVLFLVSLTCGFLGTDIYLTNPHVGLVGGRRNELGILTVE